MRSNSFTPRWHAFRISFTSLASLIIRICSTIDGAFTSFAPRGRNFANPSLSATLKCAASIPILRSPRVPLIQLLNPACTDFPFSILILAALTSSRDCSVYRPSVKNTDSRLLMTNIPALPVNPQRYLTLGRWVTINASSRAPSNASCARFIRPLWSISNPVTISF